MHLSVAPTRETRTNGVNTVLEEVMTENFEELKKVTNPQIQEAKLVLSKINNKDSDFISFG